jgi:hypothetical protein
MSMSEFRVRPRAISSTPTRFSEREIHAAGLPKDLFGASNVAFRRVEKVTGTSLEVEGGRVPMGRLGAVKPGQWLRFSRVDGGVEVKVDHDATQRAEGRMADLFQQLKKR